MTDQDRKLAQKPTVYLVEDDDAVRSALELLMLSAELPCRTFASGKAFLEAYEDTWTGCVVTDMRMPGLSGLDLQERIAELAWPLPVIIITGHGDVPAAVRAMKQGALDFLEKPFSDQVLLDAVLKAIDRDLQAREVHSEADALRALVASLTDREREVMRGVVAGNPNKIIADDLHLSIKTVEFHRANVMSKLGVSSVADLVRLALQAGLTP